MGQALHTAAKEGNAEDIRALLDKGARVDAKDKLGWTALHYAAWNGHTEAVKALLDKGASMDAKDKFGWTALHRAARLGHTGAVKALLEKGASADAKDKDGWTALHYAAQHYHTDAFGLLVEAETVDSRDTDGWTALHYAAKYGHTGAVKMLLTKGASADAKAKSGWTALHYAAKYGHTDSVKALLEKGASIDAKANGGWTALHAAAKNGHTDAVKALLDAGVSVDARDKDSWTALHYAANGGHDDAVKALLDAGASVDARDKDSWTALHYAAKHRYTNSIKALLAAGASVDAKGKGGWTALHIAAKNGHTDAVTTLLDAGASVDAREKDSWTALHYATKAGYEDVIKALLDAGANVDAKGKGGWTALQFAALNGYTDAMKMLLQKGASVEKDQEGWTALKRAAKHGHSEAVKAVLDEFASSAGNIADSSEVALEVAAPLPSPGPPAPASPVRSASNLAAELESPQSSTASLFEDVLIKHQNDFPFSDHFKVNDLVLKRYKLESEPVARLFNAYAEAVHSQTKKEVSIKFYLDRAQFERECTNLQDCLAEKCTNVVQLIESGPKPVKCGDTDVYIAVLERLGAPVFSVISRKYEFPLDLRDSRTRARIQFYISEIIHSITEIHARKRCHGDVKPDHFLITLDNDNVKAIDLDNSYPVGESKITRATLDYAAPELLKALSHNAPCKSSYALDAWAVGLVVYKILTGSSPWVTYCESKWPAEALSDEEMRARWRAAVYSLKDNETIGLPRIQDQQAWSMVLNLLKTVPADRCLLRDSYNCSFLKGGDPTLGTNQNLADLRHSLANVHQDVKQISDDLKEISKDLKKGVASLRTFMFHVKFMPPVPRMFIVVREPESDSFQSKLNPKKWFMTTLTLRFMCERCCNVEQHPGYTLKDPKEFVKKAAPYISIGLKILSVGLQIAAKAVGAGVAADALMGVFGLGDSACIPNGICNAGRLFGGLALNVDEWQATLQIQKNKTAMEIAKFQGNEVPTGKFDFLNRPALEQLEALLQTVDPSKSRGNLQPVLVSDGLWMFCCEKCRSELKP